MQDVTNWPAFILLLCRIFLSWTVSSIDFSHDWSNWSSQSFSSTTFQKFPGFADLFSKVTVPNIECHIIH